MRWRSWAAVAGQVRAGAERLSALGLVPGSQVLSITGSTPDAVAGHLAIRAAGHRPVPPSADRSAGDLPAVDLPPVDDPHTARSPEPFEATPDPLAEEAATAEALTARLAAVPPPAKPPRGTGGRPVVVAWLDLGLPDHRTVLAWALRSRAALALEPERRDLAATAAWSRATVVALPAEDLPLLAARVRTMEAKRRKRRRWLGPLGRLGSTRPPRPLGGRLLTVLVLSSPSSSSSSSSFSAGGGFRRLSGEEIGFWTERGVHLERVGRSEND